MNNPLIQPDPGLFIWTILTFLALVALLAKFAWRPLLEALDVRQQGLRKALDDAQSAPGQPGVDPQHTHPAVPPAWNTCSEGTAERPGRQGGCPRRAAA